MLVKVFKQLKLIFSDFPKKHFYCLVGGILFLLLIIGLSRVELQNSSQKKELSSEIAIEDLVPRIQDADDKTSFNQKKIAEVKRNDSLFSILKRLGVKDDSIYDLIYSPNSELLTQIKIGKTIEVEINELNEVENLKYIEDFRSGVIAKKVKSFECTENAESKVVSGKRKCIYLVEKYKLQTEKLKVFKKVTITNSLYVDGLREGLPDSVIMDLVYIFGWDIDFVHDIRPGDSYSLIYEEIYVDGERKINGNILIAEFINRNRTHTAIRFTLPNGSSEYFSPKGRNVKKAFLRSPVKFSYISSKYNLKRRHPILHKIRAHTGVDYAASRGTPIRATGDGTIVYAEKKGGYGNLIEIKHTEDYSTRYAHLDKFHSGIKLGKKVKQSDIIGYVGRTGTATGDHLHYEFRVNGKHTDPLTVKFPNANPINELEKNKFLENSEKIIKDLKNYQSLSF
tara:strand:+ start:1523 stop:2881 length:1359 start_codon:yes stop_codon:yes gene_type:complete